MTLGAFIASATAGFTAVRVGRKMSLWIACAMIFISTAVMQTTKAIGGIYAGRLIIGLANGLLMTHSQLYIQECMPAKYRGLGISVFQYWTSLGTLIGTIVDNFTSKIMGKGSYVIPLGIVYIVPGLMTIGMLFIPESPRWLLQRGQVSSLPGFSNRSTSARQVLTITFTRQRKLKSLFVGFVRKGPPSSRNSPKSKRL
jgi:SP family sugar:H+ symporter-like MFS transporter